MTSSLNRRALLRIGGMGLLGLRLPCRCPASERSAQGASQPVATLPPLQSCILLYQPGGPSHLDTWDMKPDAPVEIRGEFRDIATTVPGLRVCEHLPNMARLADKLTIVRSLRHAMRDHNAAAVETLCGHTPLEPDGLIFADHANSFPCFGAALSYLDRDCPRDLPAHVALPHVVTRSVVLPGQGPGFLGAGYGPFQVSQDLNAADFRLGALALPGDVSVQRLEHRDSLRRVLDGQVRRAEASARAQDGHYERAYTLLGSDAARRAFDIGQEDVHIRDRYGRTKHGQSVLMARRLVEAGVRFVTVNFAHGDDDIGGGDDWDTHDENFAILKDAVLPAADRAFSALVEDLDARGLLDSTLIVWMGEFGRTPRVTKAAGGGRDHWPDCFSVVLAGGGVTGGAVHGASDKVGAYPASDPVSCGELAATIFWRFGLDPATPLNDLKGRPYPLAPGQPLRALFA